MKKMKKKTVQLRKSKKQCKKKTYVHTYGGKEKKGEGVCFFLFLFWDEDNYIVSWSNKKKAKNWNGREGRKKKKRERM